MFTKWQQIEEWITDNGFQRWIFFKNNPETRDADRANDKVLDSKFYPGNIDEKLALTKKHLEQWGAKAYGWAYKTENATVGACVCEVRLDAVPDMPVQQQPIQQLPVAGSSIDEEKLRASIKKEIEAEFEKKEFEKEKQELAKEKKEFERVKASAIGILVQQFGPYADAIAGFLKQKRMVAGVDAENPVTAKPIQTLTPEQPNQPEEESPFSDEEADTLFHLMARFKKIEPGYLVMLSKVVELAEAKDNAYSFAKNFLMGES